MDAVGLLVGVALVALVLGVVLSYAVLRPRLSRAEAEKEAAQALATRAEAEKTHALEQQRQEAERRERERWQLLRTEFQQVARDVLKQETQQSEKQSEERLEQVVRPLHTHLEQLGRALQEANEKGAARHSLFDDAMRRLSEQTLQIGEQAAGLTRALRGESKTQGDWGEMILESILEHSQLRKDEEYFVQETTRDASGHLLRPDVVVRFPDERQVIIDSKVSLSAFMDYCNADDAAAAQRAIKAHVQSVRKHVAELSAKDYTRVVRDAGNYVLMFMQSDAAYILAVKNDEKLNQDAFRSRVILTSPTTLMMTLQIIYNIWQSDRQTRNVEKIIARANALYDKFVLFTDTFRRAGEGLRRAQEVYDKSMNQLADGKGNLVSRFDDLRRMGLTPKKELSGLKNDETESL